jgi:hypothetical protein
VKRKNKLTPVSIFHYYRLVYRSVLFIVLLVLYIIYRCNNGPAIFEYIEQMPLIIVLTCALFAIEMVLRFFPSRLESPGCQKQFARNYIKSGETEIAIQDNNGTVLVLLIWIGFNAGIGALYMADVIDDGIMLLISCAYSVCDMICILFFCPFQTLLLKNKCCSTCRIYNWDYAMMFTPLFFVRKPYTWGLLALSIALLIRWEVTFYLHPERFSEQTNDYLRCQNCTEKLCTHKKQLKSLWEHIAEYTAKRKKLLLK